MSIQPNFFLKPIVHPEEVQEDFTAELEDPGFNFTPNRLYFKNATFNFKQQAEAAGPSISIKLYDDYGERATQINITFPNDTLAFGEVVENVHALSVLNPKDRKITDKQIKEILSKASDAGADIKFDLVWPDPFVERNYPRMLETLYRVGFKIEPAPDTAKQPAKMYEASITNGSMEEPFEVKEVEDLDHGLDSKFHWVHFDGKPSSEQLEYLEQEFGINKATIERSEKYRTTQDVEEMPYGLFVSNPLFSTRFGDKRTLQVGRLHCFLGKIEDQEFLVTIQSGSPDKLKVDLKRALSSVKTEDSIPISVQVFDRLSLYINRENQITFEELGEALNDISERSTVAESADNTEARQALKRLIKPIQDIQDYVASHRNVGIKLAHYLRDIDDGRIFADVVGSRHKDLVTGAARLNERLRLTRSRREENESRRWMIARDKYNKAVRPLGVIGSSLMLYGLWDMVATSESPTSALIRLVVSVAAATTAMWLTTLKQERPERDILAHRYTEK